MQRTLMIMTLLCFIAGGALAGHKEDRWGLGLEFGYWKQMGGDRDYSNVDQFGTLKLRYGLTEHWTLDAGFKYGWFRPGVERKGDDAGFTTKSGTALYTRTWQPNIMATYDFQPDSSVHPWLTGGLGVTRWDIRDLRNGESAGLWPQGESLDVYDKDGTLNSGHGVNFTAILGAGVGFDAGDNWTFDLGVRYNFLFAQNNDSVGMSAPDIWGADHTDANTGIFEGQVGVSYWFGSSDNDKDGIPNSRDAAPDDPEDIDGYRDEDGVPDPDNDNDGVLDAVDLAPMDPEDIDGFQDEDGVPDPDNDGDGIIDADDQCPDEAEDFDGFQDEDGCPDPDNDGDGVLDADDRCEGTPAGVLVDEHGCPVVEEIRAGLVLDDVTFQLGRADLATSSQATLNEVAASLLAWPEVRIEVGGHTDSSGDADFNRQLSQDRAESVRQYLISQGVEPSRVTAKGYGEDRPMADNGTREGREANRRVTLKRLEG